MRLVRFGAPGSERPGLLDSDGRIRDLSGVVRDIDATTLSPALLARIAATDLAALPAVAGQQRFAPPVGAIGKLIAIGLNYRDHAAEAGLAAPREPVIFMKATSCIVGANDPISLPRGALKTDWEVELGIVIGARASYVSVADAPRHVAGYLIAHDVSERSFQLERGGQWDKGKGCDTFGPLGPWLVTPDEIADPQALDLWLKVNGEIMQQGNTCNMIFPCAQLLSYVSEFMTLLPGDVLITGTPAGVGMGRKPPRYLQAGDVVELGITGLGTQRQQVR